MGEGERESSVHIKRRKLPAVVQVAHCMNFTADSSRLLLAGPRGLIWVVDPKRAELVHTFLIPSHDNSIGWANGIVKVMCTNSDGQWLAAASSTGHIAVFNLDVLRHQWTVPALDGTPGTAMVFHPGNNNVLIVSSAANQIHTFDVQGRAPGEWSRRNGAPFAKRMLSFPGSITGPSLPSLPTSTSVIAYSSSAMCHIDLTVSSGSIIRQGKSLTVVNMRNPVLFLGRTGAESVLVAEKPWLEVLRQFPALVSRHVYGS